MVSVQHVAVYLLQRRGLPLRGCLHLSSWPRGRGSVDRGRCRLRIAHSSRTDGEHSQTCAQHMLPGLAACCTAGFQIVSTLSDWVRHSGRRTPHLDERRTGADIGLQPELLMSWHGCWQEIVPVQRTSSVEWCNHRVQACDTTKHIKRTKSQLLRAMQTSRTG